MRSIDTFSPNSSTSAALSLLDDPMLMLTARFIERPPFLE
jgi:hypothetical protein